VRRILDAAAGRSDAVDPAEASTSLRLRAYLNVRLPSSVDRAGDIGRRQAITILEYRILRRVLTRPNEIRVAEACGLSRDRSPVGVANLERRERTPKNGFGLARVGQPIGDNIIEATDQRVVEDLRVVRGGDEDAV
jgi:hypothetical protein